MKNIITLKDKIHLIVGLICILLGIICNEWFLAELLSSDGVIATPRRVIIWIVNFFLVSIGIIVIIFRGSSKKDLLLVISGICCIALSIILSKRYLPVLISLDMNSVNLVLVRVTDFYLFCTGAMLITFRKYLCRLIETKGALLFVISNTAWIILFLSLLLSLDFSASYLRLRMKSHANFTGISDSREPSLTMDDQLGWKLKENSHIRLKGIGNVDIIKEIDEHGFRKINYNIENPDYSIYFFGDSFTFGHGVSNKDTFPNIIKNKYLKKNINVYNAGVGAYGIVQIFQRFLNNEGRIKQGDLVIFTPLSDDIRRNIKDFYFPYFHYCANLIHFDKYPFFDNGLIKYHKMEKSLSNKLRVVAFGAPLTGSLWHSIYKKNIPDTTKEAIEMIKIVKLKTERKGGKFVLFFLPETGECLNKNYAVDVSGFNYHDIRHFFPSKKEELYKLRISTKDAHWTVEGHEIAARAIIETLINEKIIDKKCLKLN